MNRLFRKTVIVFLASIIGFASATWAQTTSAAYAEIDSLNKWFDDAITIDYTKADSLTQEALALAQKTAYSKGQAIATYHLGIIYRQRGNYSDALKYYFAALQLYDQYKLNKNNEDYTTLLRSIAIAFLFIEDYNRGLEYSYKVAQIAQSIGDKKQLGMAYHLIGNMYIGNQQLDSGLAYHTKAKALFIQTNSLSKLADLYIDMGINDAQVGNNLQSVSYTQKALNIYRQLGYTERYAVTFFNIGQDFYLLKLYPQALTYLDSAQHYFLKFGRPGDLIDVYQLKAKVYTEVGKAAATGYYYEKAMALKDSMYNHTYKKELAALQTQYDVYKTTTENTLLQKDKRIALLYRNLAIAGILILVTLLVIVLLRQRFNVQKSVRQQLQQEVAWRTAEIQQQKEQLDQANLRLQLSLNRAKVDPHFLFNVLNAIQHIILQKKPQEAQDHLAKLSRLMRYVLEKSSLDYVSLGEEVTMLERYIQLEQLRMDHTFQYQIDIQAPSDTPIPAMLIQPYIENAIIHGITPATTLNVLLQIKAVVVNDRLAIEIIDNGVGRKQPSNSDHTSLGNTLGMERLAILTQLHHKPYTIRIEDLIAESNTTGTKVVIHIPLATNNS